MERVCSQHGFALCPYCKSEDPQPNIEKLLKQIVDSTVAEIKYLRARAEKAEADLAVERKKEK